MLKHNLREALPDNRSTRRSFLQTAAAGTAGLAWGPNTLTAAGQRATPQEPAIPGQLAQLSEHLYVYHGPIHVGVVRHGEKALLIDVGDGSVVDALSKQGITTVEQIALTHHHRDQAFGAQELAAAGTKIGVPSGEREYFANPASYWENDKYLWGAYEFRPHPLMLVQSLRVDQQYDDAFRMTFGSAKIRVLATPGHTEGSVSYLVEVDGKRVIFCGDLIYDEGQVWDVYSLQKGFGRGQRQVRGYHGFMGDHQRLLDSLERVKREQCNLLVPSHGHVMGEPTRAIDKLAEQLRTCYENYVGISALRHYFPALFTDLAGRSGQMPIRPGITPPDCLRHFGTTWMLVSAGGAAFVMDVGSPGIVRRIKKMQQQGEIKNVEGLWVTHYHNDHTAGILEFQREFDCPCITDRRLANVLTDPTAWRLPCLLPEPIRVDRPTDDGQSWPWHEFKLTSYFYPGQTLYHAALLVEHQEQRMLFVGDSHTMSGIDDYCAYNRNWLGRDVGFQYCLSLIERLMPTHIFNCHVNDAFTFTRQEIEFMRRNLSRREQLFGELVPWDHANYGLDPSWVRCHPYTQPAEPGQTVRLEVVIMNHSRQTQAAACRVVLPRALGASAGPWSHADVLGKSEGRLAVSFDLPARTRPGRYVVPVDITYGSWKLPQLTEAIVDVPPESIDS